MLQRIRINLYLQTHLIIINIRIFNGSYLDHNSFLTNLCLQIEMWILTRTTLKQLDSIFLARGSLFLYFIVKNTSFEA